MKGKSFWGLVILAVASVAAFIPSVKALVKPASNFALVPGTCIFISSQNWSCTTDPTADSCLTSDQSEGGNYASEAACRATNP